MKISPFTCWHMGQTKRFIQLNEILRFARMGKYHSMFKTLDKLMLWSSLAWLLVEYLEEDAFPSMPPYWTPSAFGTFPSRREGIGRHITGQETLSHTHIQLLSIVLLVRVPRRALNDHAFHILMKTKALRRLARDTLSKQRNGKCINSRRLLVRSPR